MTAPPTLHAYDSARHLTGPRVWIARCTCGRESPGHDKKAAAVAEIDHHARNANNTPEPQRCPTPRRRRFNTQGAAERELTARWKRVRPGRLHTRTYQCVCRKWHYTKAG